MDWTAAWCRFLQKHTLFCNTWKRCSKTFKNKNGMASGCAGEQFSFIPEWNYLVPWARGPLEGSVGRGWMDAARPAHEQLPPPEFTPTVSPARVLSVRFLFPAPCEG